MIKIDKGGEVLVNRCSEKCNKFRQEKITMRKILIYIPFLLIALFLTFSKQIIFAGNNNEKYLQIECGEYRNDILDYIQNNWMNFFADEEIEEYAGSDIVVGGAVWSL